VLTTDGGKRLADYCAEHGLEPGDQVFYDSLRRGLVGSENDQEAVSQLWAATLPLSRAGINIHFAHHMPKPKGSKMSKHLASGSTDILAGADSSVSIKRNGTTITVTQEKNRAAVEAKPFGVTFRFDGDAQNGPVHVEYGTGSGASSVPGVATNESKILTFLGQQPEGQVQTGAILEGAGVPASSGHETLNKLSVMGLVENVEHGVWRLVTVRKRTGA
jgi:hypothetical protein